MEQGVPGGVRIGGAAGEQLSRQLPSTSGISPAATSLGAARTISVPPPKSSASKPNRSSRGSWASSAAPSSAGGVNTTGSSRACTMGW